MLLEALVGVLLHVVEIVDESELRQLLIASSAPFARWVHLRSERPPVREKVNDSEAPRRATATYDSCTRTKCRASEQRCTRNTDSCRCWRRTAEAAQAEQLGVWWRWRCKHAALLFFAAGQLRFISLRCH